METIPEKLLLTIENVITGYKYFHIVFHSAGCTLIKIWKNKYK